MGGINKKNYSIYVILASSLLFFLLLIFKELYLPINKTIKYSKLIYDGVSVNGVDVGGKNYDEALKILETSLNGKIKASKVYFKYDGKTFTEDIERFKINYDIEDAVNNALNYGKKDKSIIIRTIQRIKTKKNKHIIRSIIEYDFISIEEYYKELSRIVDRKPKDACIFFNGERIIIEDEVDGIELERERFIDITKSKFMQGMFEVDLPVKVITPNLSAGMISGKISTLASFSTPLLSKNKNRTNNIIIAASYVNGTIISPGDIFSANSSIGPRTYKRGYTDAPVFAGKKVVPGIAGGICQLVTTIYNAALNSDMKIVERRRHSMPVAYAPPGLDATIAGNSIDLKFMNSKKFPIYIESYVKDDRVWVNIYEVR